MGKKRERRGMRKCERDKKNGNILDENEKRGRWKGEEKKAKE